MCRLYGLQATHCTELECGLLEAQNSLLRQSRGDARGHGNPDGWGIAVLEEDELLVRREASPAYESEAYVREATALEGSTVLAHVRRATNGRPARENTHPFRHRRSLLAHNGHLPVFGDVRPWILDRIQPDLREEIEGRTGSEHLLYWLMSRLGERTGRARADASTPEPGMLRDVLRETIVDLLEWYATSAPDFQYRVGDGGDGRLNHVAVNVLWVLDGELVGARAGRSLWFRSREGAYRCGICGGRHPAGDPEGYRAVALASERITDEEWSKVPEPSVFHVDDAFDLQTASLAV